MNGRVTITKEKYGELLEKAERFEFVQKIIFSMDPFFQKPPTRNIPTIMKEMKKVGKYSSAFLKSIENGLKKSSYFSK